MTSPASNLVARYPALLLALPPLLWAGTHIVARGVAGHVPPCGMAVGRWLVAAIVLMPFAWPHLTRDLPVLRARWRMMVLLSLAGGGVFGTLQFVAAHYTKALNVAVLNSVAPAFIVIMSVVIFRDALRRLQVVGITISLLGVVVIVCRGDFGTLQSLAFNAGDLLVTANMLLWAIYSACLRVRPDVHALTFMFALSVVSAMANLPFAVIEHAWGYPLQLSGATLLAVFYTGLGTSVVAYIAWTKGIELVGAPRASAFLHLVPLYGALLAWAILGETLGVYHVMGFALIVGGVTLAARKPNASPAPHVSRHESS